MIKPAFSTVACPEWPLERVAQAAEEHGFEAVELRTFGYGSTQIACEPALTSAEKVRRIFGDLGIEVACLSTGVRLDAPWRMTLPGMGPEAGELAVREAKSAVDLAAQIECPLVRVFGFEFPAKERRERALTRIADRLRMVADAANNTGVRLVLENGGSFRRAGEALELVERVGSPLMGVSYSMAVAEQAGEDPAEGVRVLGDRLWLAKVKDYRGGKACVPGEGEMSCRGFAAALGEAGYDGHLVFEWDRMWVPGLAAAEDVLPGAARAMYEWAGGVVRTA